jgi:uncharacterized protein YoxC
MDELLQTNVFFLITSVAVVVLTIGFSVLLYYLIPLVRDARDVMAKIVLAAQEIEEDFEQLKEAAEEEGAKTKAIADVVLGFVSRALMIRPPRKRRLKSASKR